MDIQKIIADVVAKVKNDPDLVKKLLSDPAGVLKSFGIDVSADQINAIIEGVKSKIDLKSLGLEDLDVSKAGGIIDKIKGLFGGNK